MTSNDTGVYIREDVFNARMDAFMAEIRLENEKLRNELTAKMNEKFGQLDAKIDGTETSLNAKIEGYQARNEQQFLVLSTRMDNLDTRISDLQNTMSWGFTLIAVFIAVVGIITSVFVAFAPSIWSYVRRKRQPELSRNDVKSIVAEQVKEAIAGYFSGHVDVQGK